MKEIRLYSSVGDKLLALVRIPEEHYDVVIWNEKIFIWRNVEQRYCLAKAISIHS